MKIKSLAAVASITMLAACSSSSNQYAQYTPTSATKQADSRCSTLWGNCNDNHSSMDEWFGPMGAGSQNYEY